MSRSAGNLVKLQALEESLLITSEEDRQQCLRDGRILAAKRKIELLQSQMEMIYLSIKKKCANIQNEASKQKRMYVQLIDTYKHMHNVYSCTCTSIQYIYLLQQVCPHLNIHRQYPHLSKDAKVKCS